MRKSFLHFAMGAITLLGLATSACTPDPCKDKDCGTNGTCDAASDNGDCICADGYEADAAGKCNTLGTAKFVGTWNGPENCGGTPSAAYDIAVVSTTADVKQIRITNFTNSNCDGNPLVVTGTVSKDAAGSYTKVGSFTTSCTSVTIDQAGTSISVSGNTMTVNYKISGGGNTYTCSATMTKI